MADNVCCMWSCHVMLKVPRVTLLEGKHNHAQCLRRNVMLSDQRSTKHILCEMAIDWNTAPPLSSGYSEAAGNRSLGS